MYDYEMRSPWESYWLDIEKVELPMGLTSIGKWTFNGCQIKEIEIPSSVTKIKSGAFCGCRSLTSLFVPSSVTSIGCQAFQFVPNIEYSGTVNIFSYCDPFLGSYSFDNGKGFRPRCVNGYVEGYLVYSDESKRRIVACSAAATGIISIPESVQIIDEEAFQYCTKITSIIVPNSVRKIGRWAFSFIANIIYNGKLDTGYVRSHNGYVEGCLVYEDETKTKLLACADVADTINIPMGVMEINEYVFYRCFHLKSVTIPPSVTKIGECAFSQCFKLDTIRIPDSVQEIEKSCFMDSQTIFYSGSATGSPWGAKCVIKN